MSALKPGNDVTCADGNRGRRLTVSEAWRSGVPETPLNMYGVLQIM